MGWYDNVNVRTRKRKHEADIPTLECLYPNCNVHHDRLGGIDSQGEPQSYVIDEWMMCSLLNEIIKEDDIRKEEYFKTKIKK